MRLGVLCRTYRYGMASFLSAGCIYFAGIAADVAGAVILALGFSFKRPERIREEVPRSVSTSTTPGTISMPFPQAQLESLVRQRAEARLGMTLLVIGFLLQAATYLVEPPWRLASEHEKVGAGATAVLVLLVAFMAWRLWVPANEWLTLKRPRDQALVIACCIGAGSLVRLCAASSSAPTRGRDLPIRDPSRASPLSAVTPESWFLVLRSVDATSDRPAQ